MVRSSRTESGFSVARARTTRTETTGGFDESRTTQTSGSYQLFLDMVDAQLATRDIFVALEAILIEVLDYLNTL